ncbi:MAG: opacity protein-like surface antigen [Candidatus Paceibacteria bacterium]|jgi:opacity protein-like surface antigen
MNKSALFLLISILPACMATGAGGHAPVSRNASSTVAPMAADRGLRKGAVIIQGAFGAAAYEEVRRSGGENPPLGDNGGDLRQMPLIAANWQTVMGGDRVDFGIEAGGALGFRSDSTVVATGGGGLLVGVDVDLFLFDLSVGPFINVNLGEKFRVYGAVGPLMQFANYSQDSKVDAIHVDDTGTGFGLGWYSRLGAEMAVGSGMMIGIGGRWIDSRVDLSSNLGDLDVKGAQVFLTFSTGF